MKKDRGEKIKTVASQTLGYPLGFQERLLLHRGHRQCGAAATRIPELRRVIDASASVSSDDV
jgi:hypothetical protein